MFFVYFPLFSLLFCFIETQDNDFDSATGLLGATMGRLRRLSRGSQTKLLCYMMLFALFVFFVIYWIIKLR